MAHLGALFDFRSDHKARRVAQRQNGESVRVAKHHQPCGFVRALGFNRPGHMHGVVGDHAERTPFDPQQSRDHAGTETGTQFDEGIRIRDRFDDVAHIIGAFAAFGNQVAKLERIARFPR